MRFVDRLNSLSSNWEKPVKFNLDSLAMSGADPDKKPDSDPAPEIPVPPGPEPTTPMPGDPPGAPPQPIDPPPSKPEPDSPRPVRPLSFQLGFL
jgi:hypothetical protein